MDHNEPEINRLKDQAAKKGQDSFSRKILIILLVVWLITLLFAAGFAWKAYFDERKESRTLAQQIAVACEAGDFGPGFSEEQEKDLCQNAEAVIQNDPELQDPELQETEIQEPEIQDPEIPDGEQQENERQEAENQDPEDQDPETQEGEEQNPEVQDGEEQDPEVQEPEEQDPENQDPEIDDPDPASPYTFTFTFTVPGNGVSQPSTTYTVTCNSGTGNCTVS